MAELTQHQRQFINHAELILCESCGHAVIPMSDWRCGNCDMQLPDMRRTNKLRLKWKRRARKYFYDDVHDQISEDGEKG